ncbi:MAG: ParB N-terminal domain-containing protein [Planctomycetes bacterium]|nr:ParB N-terminal domain-containing protein [Planctomycetota bacterium]
MENTVLAVAVESLVAHPDNPNKMSRSNFLKLVRNIEMTGRYEPLIVRPAPYKEGFFQIINGHHRLDALAELGYKSVDVIVWDVDDEQTDMLLVTLNRLGGSDELSRKLVLLKRLSRKLNGIELSKLIPQTTKQIERLTNLKMPSIAAKTDGGLDLSPLIFFVDDSQRKIIEKALSLVDEPKVKMSTAVMRATRLVHMAEYFFNHSKISSLGACND